MDSLFTFDELGFPVDPQEQQRQASARSRSSSMRDRSNNGPRSDNYVRGILARFGQMTPQQLAQVSSHLPAQLKGSSNSNNNNNNKDSNSKDNGSVAASQNVHDLRMDDSHDDDDDDDLHASHSIDKRNKRGDARLHNATSSTEVQVPPLGAASGLGAIAQQPVYRFHDSVDYESLAREVAELQRQRHERQRGNGSGSDDPLRSSPASARGERSGNYRRTQAQGVRDRLFRRALQPPNQSNEELSDTHGASTAIDSGPEHPNRDNDFFYTHPEAADLALLAVSTTRRVQGEPRNAAGAGQDQRLSVGSPRNQRHPEQHQLSAMIRRWKLYRGNPTALFDGMDFQAPPGTRERQAQKRRSDAQGERALQEEAAEIRGAERRADVAQDDDAEPVLRPRRGRGWGVVLNRMHSHANDGDGDSRDSASDDLSDFAEQDASGSSDNSTTRSRDDAAVDSSRQRQRRQDMRRRHQSAGEALRLLRLYAAFTHRTERQIAGVHSARRRAYLQPFLARWRLAAKAVHHHRLVVLRRHFERLRFFVNQELQRDSLLLVADEYRALRLASRGIVALQRHAGRRHVNRALGQLADAHLRRQRLKVGLQSVRAHVFESKKRRIQERAAAAEGSQKLLRRCFRRWAVVAHNATEMQRATVHHNRFAARAALRRWQSAARRRVVQCLKIHDARVYFALRLQLRVLKGWQAAVEEQRHLQVVDSRLVRVRVRQAVRRWAGWTRVRSQDRLDEAKAQRFYWSHSIARVFFSWQKFAHEHAQLFLATQFSRLSKLQSVIFAWSSAAKHAGDQRVLLRRADVHRRRRQLRPALVLWAERTSAARRQAAANTFARHVALRRGLDALKLSHSKHSHVKHAESATHQAQSRRRLRTCFRQWQGALELEQRSKPIKKQLAHAHNRTLLRQGLDAFRKVMDHLQHRLSLARIIYCKKLRRRMFRAWVRAAANGRDIKQHAEHAIKRTAFNRWAVVREAVKLREEAASLAILRIRHRLLSRTFSAWDDFSQGRKLHRAVETCCLQWGRRRVLGRAWEKWRERFVAVWEQREMDTVADDYIRMRRLDVGLQALKSWLRGRLDQQHRFREAAAVQPLTRHQPPTIADSLANWELAAQVFLSWHGQAKRQKQSREQRIVDGLDMWRTAANKTLRERYDRYGRYYYRGMPADEHKLAAGEASRMVRRPGDSPGDYGLRKSRLSEGVELPSASIPVGALSPAAGAQRGGSVGGHSIALSATQKFESK